MTSKITASLLADKKKILNKIKNLHSLITKGNPSKNLEGSNAVFQKVFYALKDQPKIPLEKVNMSMFDTYGFLRADNFYIGKINGSFSLFKAKEIDTIDDKITKKLEKKAKAMVKSLADNKQPLKKVIKDVPFLEWKVLNKTDIAERLYQEAKKDKALYEAVGMFCGKEKLLKKDFLDLNYGEMSYIASSYEKKIQHTKFYDVCDKYLLKNVKDELRLKRGADKNAINSELLKEFKSKIDQIEDGILSLQEALEFAKSSNSENRSEKILSITMELLEYRKQLTDIEIDIEKNIKDPNMEELSSILWEMKEDGNKYQSNELQYYAIDELNYTGEEGNEKYLKIGLKKKDELITFFKENEEGITKELEIEVFKEVKITNYGIFTDTNPSKALENLLSYAKSINEMVTNNDYEEKQLKENSGNFAI